MKILIILQISSSFTTCPRKIKIYSKKGVIVIINNDKKFILDLESNTDITNSDYIEIRNTKKTKKQIIFKNIIYDEELLAKLSNE